jgi:hypothetical protein
LLFISVAAASNSKSSLPSFLRNGQGLSWSLSKSTSFSSADLSASSGSESGAGSSSQVLSLLIQNRSQYMSVWSLVW